MKEHESVISIHHEITDPYRIHGINHFIQKYGIQIKFNTESEINVVYGSSLKDIKGFNIQIVENEMQNDISGYLKIDTEKIPLFEKPIRLDESGEPLVIFADEENGYPCVVLENNSIKIGFDIFNEVGHILAGHLEHFWKSSETSMTHGDTHEHETGKVFSEQNKQLAKVPVVDYYEKILFDCFIVASKNLNVKLEYKPFWPNGKKFAVCLTHDVDEVKKTYQYITRPLRYIKRGDYRGVLNQISSLMQKIKGAEPYWTFEKIMDIEKRHNVKSTFFFLNEKGKVNLFDPKSWKLYGRRYDINSRKISTIIEKLKSEGWEIGVHGSYYSYLDLEMLEKEKGEMEKILKSKVYGIRQHHLNLEIPETWRYHEKVGFEYDTSLGFQDKIGFRGGTCFPFNPFDSRKGKSIPLIEIPLTIMDTPLFSSKEEDIWKDCINTINIVERHQGVLTLLWHHAVFNNYEYPGWTERYEKMIEMCKEKNAWITNANDLIEWLIMREKQINTIYKKP